MSNVLSKEKKQQVIALGKLGWPFSAKPAVRSICKARRELNVVTDPNALALPPKVSAKEVAAYGLYVAKQTLHGRLFESISKLKGNLPCASHRQYRRRRNGETTETGQRSWESGPSGSS